MKYYTIQIEALNCNYNLTINGIEVDKEERDNTTNVELPINQWVINGPNTFECTITALTIADHFAEKATVCDFIIYARDHNADRDDRTEVARLSFPSFEDPGVFQQTELSSSGQFMASPDFKPHPWVNGDTWEISQESYNMVLDVYKQYHQYLQGENIEGLMQLTRFKDIDMAKSFYYNQEDYLNRIRKFLTDEFSRSGNVLIGLDVQLTDGLTPRLYHFNKLVTLRNKDGNTPLFIYNEEDDDLTYFDIMLYLSEGKPIIIR